MALIKKNIKVISQELIKPSSPTPNHLRFLPSSLFDHVHTATLTPLLFFYPNINNASSQKLLDRLKTSLPNTLSVFYPLAGRILDDTNVFICNDEGVLYVQTLVDKPLEDVVCKVQPSELDELLTPYGQRGYTTLLLAIQANVFACGGVAIGIQLNHAISNVSGMLKFVETWATIANGNKEHLNSLPRPNFDIWSLFPPPPPRKSQNVNATITDSQVTKWFVLSEAKLKSLYLNFLSSYYKNSNNNNNNNKSRPPSLVRVLSAFIWSRVKIACHGNTIDIPHHVSQVLTVHSKLSPPDERSYYFGNMVVTAIAKLSNEFSMEEFLEQTKESVARMNNNGLIRNMQEGNEDLNYIPEYVEKGNKQEIIPLMFNNIINMPLYEVDFGWGKPVWVAFATLRTKNMVKFIPSPTAGASIKDIVVYINLSPGKMAGLEGDPEFDSLLCKTFHGKSKL